MRTPQAVPFLAALCAALVGCSTGLDYPSPPAPSPITPSYAETKPGERVQFTATFAADGQTVLWSVREQEGGQVDATGAYTAPSVEGTFTVVAANPATDEVHTAQVVVRTTPTPDPGPQPEPGLPSQPPADGTTAWAPAASDTSFANVRSHGAVGDGVTDDTAAFRAAAATGKKLFIPAAPVSYKLTGVVRLQDSAYGDGSMPLIRMHGADGDPDQRQTRNIFYVTGYRGTGLVIQGLHLDGGWDGGGRGEWGHCININSSNVTVQHNRIENAYGDDVFVGGFSGAPADNVVIQDNVLRTARRCNVAANHATGLVIRRNQIIKTGSTYVSAIDLEPDELGFQYVRGVVIDGNTFEVIAQEWNTGAISMNNPVMNPDSGDVSITNNGGTWSPVMGYMDVVPGSGSLVGIVPHKPWYNVTASNNVRR